MKLQNYHYSNFLISVHFGQSLVPKTLSEQIKNCEDFLKDLGKLALENGRRLFSTYSIASGKSDPHAHFTVSWLPLTAGHARIAKNGRKRINRPPVIELLENNGFVVDNEKQAIKRVTHDKRFVTEYVIYQPKIGQKTIHSAFFVYEDFEVNHSKKNSQSYKCPAFFTESEIKHKRGCIHKLNLLIMICLISFITISSFIALLL